MDARTKAMYANNGIIITKEKLEVMQENKWQAEKRVTL